MPKGRLRIYYGPQSADAPVIEESSPRRTVEVTLGEIFPVLADAMRTRRGWLDDFADDLVTISSDLYEVLLAYQHYRRPPA
jgi:hypothetical protein